VCNILPNDMFCDVKQMDVFVFEGTSRRKQLDKFGEFKEFKEFNEFNEFNDC